MTSIPHALFGSIHPSEGGRATVSFERPLAASPDEVWAALTEPERLAEWLCRSDVDLRVGGQIHHYLGESQDDQAYGQILALDPPRLLEYEWHFTGEDQSVVRFELTPADAGTVLRLTHTLLPTAQAAGYAPGWHAYLDQLSASISGEPVPAWEDRFAALRAEYA